MITLIIALVRESSNIEITDADTDRALSMSSIGFDGLTTLAAPLEIVDVPEDASTGTFNCCLFFMFHRDIHTSNMKKVVIRWS